MTTNGGRSLAVKPAVHGFPAPLPGTDLIQVLADKFLIVYFQQNFQQLKVFICFFHNFLWVKRVTKYHAKYPEDGILNKLEQNQIVAYSYTF